MIPTIQRLNLRPIVALSPTGGGFSPLDIVGLQLWLDGSDITTLFQDSAKTTPVTADGDVVGAWADKSGNGNDATQATTENKPLYKTAIQNGLSVVRFATNDALLLTGMTVASGNYTIFAVLETGGGADEFLFDVATGRIILVVEGTAAAYFDGGWRGTEIVGTDPEVVVWKLDSTGGNSAVVRLNGAVSQSGLSYTQRATGGAVCLGAQNSGAASFYNGDLDEFLVYSSALSTDNIVSIENYLNAKWAMY